MSAQGNRLVAPPFVHLHVHSLHSAMDGLATVEELCGRATRQGFIAMALTDTNGLYGMPRFVRAARHAALKPIVGAELVHESHGAVALVKNRAGYENLCRVISALHGGHGFDLVEALPRPRS